MVGASSNPDKASHGIMQKLQRAGYNVIPVNPRETEVLGERAYASLVDIPERVDIVDVFRRAEDTPAIADEAVTIGAKALWLQTGIANEDAAAQRDGRRADRRDGRVHRRDALAAAHPAEAGRAERGLQASASIACSSRVTSPSS